MAHLKGKQLIIRADASTEIGAGHLMRCLALAQAWKDAGGQVTFTSACQSDDLLQQLRDEGFDIHPLTHPYPDSGDWNYTKNILAAYPSAWVVLDGYHFNEVYQQRVKEAGHRLLVIDDVAHLKHYYADIVLNQNLHAPQLHYSCELYTRLLLGTRYVLLRREFLGWKDWRRDIPEVARRVLVTLGGGDPENYTLKVFQALQRVDVPGLEATVVIGATNRHEDKLEKAVRKSSIPIRLVRNAENMPELMAWADVAVSAAGSTVWELMFMGVPAILISVADNQKQIAESAEAAAVAIHVNRRSSGWPEKIADALQGLILDAKIRSTFSYEGRSLVDGLGRTHVIQAIQAMRPAETYQR